MKLGILDYLDVFLGRLSDSDTATGKRKRSWGTTVMFWFSLPIIFLILSTGVSQIIVASSSIPRIDKKSLTAYQICINNAKSARSKCAFPKIKSSSSIRGLDFGKWPWIGAIIVFLTGVLFALFRRKQDFERFKEIGELAKSFVAKDAQLPSDVLSLLKGAAQKMMGDSSSDDFEGGKKGISETKDVLPKNPSPPSLEINTHGGH